MAKDPICGMTVDESRERGANPESPLHVAQFSVFFDIRRRCRGQRFQWHATLGAIAGAILLDFGMHRAGPDTSLGCFGSA